MTNSRSPYEGHGPDPAGFEPAHTVRREVLSEEAREDLRQHARAIALETMSADEWEARRQASGNPVLADVEAIFGDKGPRQ